MKRAISICVILISICGLISGCQRQNNENNPMADNRIIGFGDDFSKIPVINLENEQEYLNTSQKYRLIFVFDPLCGTCKRQLEVITYFKSFYEPFLDVSILWEDQVIETSILEQYDVPENINYLLGMNSISISTPTALIVGKDNRVLFVSSDMDKIAMKINRLDGISMETVRKNVCNFFFEKCKSKKDIMIYFALQGCHDCEMADEVIDNDIEEKYLITKIYDSEAYGEEEYVDLDNIYRSIFDIDWYPSFLLIDKNNNYKFVGKTDIRELKATLMSEKKNGISAE